MSVERLDYLFPFIVFFYGFIKVAILAHPTLMELAKTRLPQSVYGQLRRTEVIGWICFFVGGLWSLQNVLISL